MYSSYSAAAFTLRAAKSSLQAHSSYTNSYLPSHHCHRADADEQRRHHHRHHEFITQSTCLYPRLLLDGCLLRHSAHLLLRARLWPSVPPHQHKPGCCRRQASARCFCGGGGGRPVDGKLSWPVEVSGCRYCPRGTGMSDLGAICRRLKAPECRCDSSGGGRLVGSDYGRRDTLRLLGRAVRQEVWEYEGVQWPRSRCSTECHDNWEDEEEEYGYGRWEVVGGMRFGRRWEDDVEDLDSHCRDCCRRKGLESYCSGEDAYSGRCRERRDVDAGRRWFRHSDRRGWQRREYYDGEDDLDLRRQRHRLEGRGKRDLDDAVETRTVETRRYRDGGREYNRRRERRDFDSDDMADARRAGQHAEDLGRFDRRRESRNFEIDDKVDVRREGRHQSNDDHKYVSWHQGCEDTNGEDVSLLRSHCWNDKEFDYHEQDLAERRYYSGARSKKSATASSLHEDDANMASSSRSTVDTRQEKNSSSRVRRLGNVDRQIEQISEERDQQHSVGWSNDERDTHDYDDARFVRLRDSRIGAKDVKVITEDDARLVSSSKNTSILKHSSNADQQAAIHKDESRKKTQKIMEISDIQDNSTEQDSSAQSYHQEDRENYSENRSSSVQDSVKMASECRRQVDQHNEVNHNLVSLTESWKNSEDLTNIKTDSSCNISRASHLLRNYNEVNQLDIDDRSTSLQHITHVTRDKKRIVNQQVIHGMDIDVQNIAHIDVSKSRPNHTSTSGSLQSHLETRSDVNSTSNISFINSTRNQENEVFENRISASESGMVRGSHSHLESGLYDRFHSTSSSNVADNTRESQEQIELITSASNAKSSQDSRDRMVRSEDTHHNMDLIWQHADTSGNSDNKDITRLMVDSIEEGSSTVNLEMTQQTAIMLSNDQEVRSETTAGSSIPSGSSARRQSVKESMLESAARLAKSSTFHVGQFVDELQKGVSDADTASTKANEKSIASSSGSRTKGPADEMWDVQSTTSQETFKTADKEEGYSADGATNNSASQTPKNESALARKDHKSLWAYVADIIRLGWIHRGHSPDSSHKSVKKSSSNNSLSTEGWVSSQERDNDGTRKKNGSTNTIDQQLVSLHSGETESGVASMSKEECLHTATQCLQTSETVIEPEVGRSEGNLFARSSTDDLHISAERIKQSDMGESPKGNNNYDNTATMENVTVGHLPGDRTATSSRITTKGSGEFNTGKIILTGSSSVTMSAMEAGHNGDGADWLYDPSGGITPYHHTQTQAVMPHQNTSTGTLEPPELPVGGSVRFEEKNVVQESPGVTKTIRKDVELKKRMFQRNKQVLKETFDEWEEAYRHDAEQRKADELFMREALLEAQRAADIWEVPVGAVLVQNGEIIARGCNLVEDLRDSTAHAEIVCIREASNKLKTWRLADTTLYVTLEPCAMCAGAILQARIDAVVWGAPNKLLGADGSWVRLFPGDGQTSTETMHQGQATGPVHPFHPKIAIRRGVLSAECSEIMQQFFQLRRQKKQKPQSPARTHHHPVKFFSKMHHMFGTIFCL
ncbi:hypothetical protein U9M48_043686 [Paspalum notatum var. saurae]|uniref:tRNA(adenine(34)) deaminase n=1 Tax=Paspalum notatum var. saurae TaxID=547442 RepID=A0AAQ3XGR0_PASNO